LTDIRQATMNRTKLKTYAPQARRDFIQAMTDRAAFYGVTGTKTEPIIQRGDVAVIGGREFPLIVAKQRQQLVDRIERDGFAQTMEAIAYTWFNRLVAIRYMEVRGYLDHGYRVLSHPEGKPTPEIVQHAEHLDLPGLSRDTAIEMKLAGDREPELYRMLLVAQCDALNRTLPFLFARIDDETELLLPDNLLRSDSLLHGLVENLDDESCESVEVLGWLYQFYIAEKKDEVMARKKAVPTDDIPAVTQLFTPHWIVRYLVENSLGRLWLLNRPSSTLREQMPYYIEGEAETDFLKINKPEEIRLCDPACGSGHMLTYAFDLLYQIYFEDGYAPNEIPGLILKHNLHGLEICPRAAQLAQLALVFKAREKSRRFLQLENLVRPQVIELCNVRFDEDELADYIHALSLGDLFSQPILELLNQFEEAKNFGSLIQPCVDEATIAFVREAIESQNLGGQLFLRDTHQKVLRVLEQAEALTQRYHVVVANPPYMGFKQMNGALRTLGDAELKECSRDLYAMFIQRNVRLRMGGGFVAMVTMDSWMYGDDHTDLRSWFYENASILTMAHLGPHAFDSIQGEVVQATAFVTAPTVQLDLKAVYARLVDEAPSSAKEAALLSGQNRFCAASRSFLNVPRKILAYQATEHTLAAFASGEPLRNIAEAFTGLQTGDNPRFIRFWHEVGNSEIRFGCSSRPQAQETGARWFPYVKGSNFRRWYGNNVCVLDWLADGEEIRQHPSSTVRNSDYYFRAGLAYNNIANSFSVRAVEEGFICDQKNSMFFSDTNENSVLALGLLNSPVMSPFLEILSPKDFNPGSLKIVPVLPGVLRGLPIRSVVTKLVSIARADWDNFETSWDFRDQPLLRPGLKGVTLEASWRNWESHSTAAIRRMQELETENNRLFIAAYGLEGELQPEVPEEQITLARAEVRRDMAAFLSYAVGCMMGRYSPDHPGLILADAGDTLREFLAKVAKPLAELSFVPDDDGIIPVLDGEWFDDDIVLRVREFLRVTFGESTLADNIRFIETSLGKDLRSYFQNGFYKDHLQTYKKRPIYWLFSSGKQRAFQCLVYLHRYHEGTLARMRTEYVIPLQGQITGRIEQLEGDKLKATSTSHRKKLQKEQDKLKKQQVELLAFEEKLHHLADQRIKLDLDDGVKVNYAKFGDLLAESKAICGTKSDD